MENLLCTQPSLSVEIDLGLKKDAVISCFSITSNGTVIPVKIEVVIDANVDAECVASVSVNDEIVQTTRGAIKLGEDIVNAVTEKMRDIKVLVVEPHEFYKYPDNMNQTDSWIMITRNLGVVFLRGVIPDLWTVTFGRNDGLADMPEDWNILVVSVDTDGEPSSIPSGLCGYISKTMELPANPIN